MSDPIETTTAERQFPCHQCGANLLFAPGTASLQCKYCGAKNEIPVEQVEIEELDFRAHVDQYTATQPTRETNVVKCQACAAESDFPEGRVSDRCPFCGSPMVTQSQSRRVIKPDWVLPFQIPHADAQRRFNGWISGLWFAPSKLKQESERSKLTGIYEPAWTYDSQTTTQYTGQRGDAYTVTVGTGKNRRTQRRIRWSYRSGVVSDTFDDVLVLASASIPNQLGDKLDPWDLKSLVKYDDAFLAGFVTESYQIDLEQGFGVAKQRMEEIIRATVRRDIGGDEQRIDRMGVNYQSITFKHLLLPVWLSTYRFRGKSYRFLVNARTGEIVGQRPYSAWKIASLVVAIIVVLAGLWMLFRQ